MEYWFSAFICPLHIAQIIPREMKFILISAAWVLPEREETHGKITSISHFSSWTIQHIFKEVRSRTFWTLSSHSLISSNSTGLRLVYDTTMERQNWKDWRLQWRCLQCKIKLSIEHTVFFFYQQFFPITSRNTNNKKKGEKKLEFFQNIFPRKVK